MTCDLRFVPAATIGTENRASVFIKTIFKAKFGFPNLLDIT